jgi:hypothetical protein
MVGPAAAALIARGVACIVATRDAALRPDIARGWGPQISATPALEAAAARLAERTAAPAPA